MRGVHLKRRYADKAKRRWFWLLRWPSFDGAHEHGDTIGYYCPSRGEKGSGVVFRVLLRVRGR